MKKKPARWKRLASAMEVRGRLPAGNSTLNIVCADGGLKTAAKIERFRVYDPKNPDESDAMV